MDAEKALLYMDGVGLSITVELVSVIKLSAFVIDAFDSLNAGANRWKRR